MAKDKSKDYASAFEAVPHADKLWFNENGDYYTAFHSREELVEVERPKKVKAKEPEE